MTDVVFTILFILSQIFLLQYQGVQSLASNTTILPLFRTVRHTQKQTKAKQAMAGNCDWQGCKAGLVVFTGFAGLCGAALLGMASRASRLTRQEGRHGNLQERRLTTEVEDREQQCTRREADSTAAKAAAHKERRQAEEILQQAEEKVAAAEALDARLADSKSAFQVLLNVGFL